MCDAQHAVRTNMSGSKMLKAEHKLPGYGTLNEMFKTNFVVAGRQNQCKPARTTRA